MYSPEAEQLIYDENNTYEDIEVDRTRQDTVTQ